MLLSNSDHTMMNYVVFIAFNDIHDHLSCHCLLCIFSFITRCDGTYSFVFVLSFLFCIIIVHVLLFLSRLEGSLPLSCCLPQNVNGCWLIQVLCTARVALCQRPGKLTLPAPALPFQEEITVSWIINENKLANIKYWKGNVCMLTIKMASEALTCLKERACQPNASPPTYLPGISQH